MKSIFITFVAVAAVFAKSSEAGDNDGGIYFDEGEVALACTAGTAMGEKLADAMNNCIGVDAEGKAVEEVMKADLMELPAEVSTPLAKDKLTICAEEMFTKKNEKYKKCSKKYSEEEKAELKQLGMKVSGFKCFQKEFGNSCKNLVRDQIYNFYKQKMEGATTTA